MAGGTLKAGIVNKSDGSPSIITNYISTEGRYKRQIYTQVDTTSRTASTTYVLGPTFANVTNWQAGSIIKLFYHVPYRYDTTAWGGAYTEPQVSFNGGTTWYSLGSSGFDGVMSNSYNNIASYRNTVYIDPAQTSTFQVQFRFYFKAYTAGTLNWNGSHAIDTISGTATKLAGDNGNQHYMHIVVHELALLKP